VNCAVKTERLTKQYAGGAKALDSLDLEVDRGEVFALLGPNGAGKTTLMRILTTQIAPTDGRSYVLGMDVEKEGGRIRRRISYVPQETSVWGDITGYENLLIYSKLYGVPREIRAKRIADACGIMDLEEALNRRTKEYSGGMIRRLEMACALITEPEILFLDEPTLGLDPSMRKKMWTALERLRKERDVTIFFNTHYMDEADLYSDEMGIINAGRIVARGEAEELKDRVEKERIIIRTREPEDARNRLSSLFDDIAVEGNSVIIRTENGERGLAELLGKITDADSISLEKPTLDDVFMKYAGVRMRGNGENRRKKHG